MEIWLILSKLQANKDLKFLYNGAIIAVAALNLKPHFLITIICMYSLSTVLPACSCDYCNTFPILPTNSIEYW